MKTNTIKICSNCEWEIIYSYLGKFSVTNYCHLKQDTLGEVVMETSVDEILMEVFVENKIETRLRSTE